MNPASPLQSSAEDFLESLQQSPGSALAELVNLILRACGCSDSVNADEAVDFDGIVSTLDDFTESLKQVSIRAPALDVGELIILFRKILLSIP
jgi:cohesin complex subunit SA-1/2